MRDVFRACTKRMKAILLTVILILSTLIIAIPVSAVDPVIYHVATTGDDTTGDGSEGTPWLTIQHAIDEAEAGDIILVAVGTYAENLDIPPGKDNLQLLGDGMESTILSPASGTAIDLGSPITIKGFHILQSDSSSAILIAWGSSGVSGTSEHPGVIEANRLESPSENRGNGVNFKDYLSDYWVIKDNVLINRELAIYLNRASHLVISGNTFTGYKEGIGTNWDGEPAHDLTITGNDFLGTDYPFTEQDLIEKAAIVIGEVSYNIEISGNTITDSPNGIRIPDHAGGVTNLANVHINNNNIYDNINYGIINEVSTAIDATLNWWGTTDYPAIEEMIDGDVEYTPCLGASIEVTPLQIHYEFEPENAGDPVDVTATGDGSFIVPDTDTSVYYDDADECIITVEDLDVDDVDEATFAAIGEYVDVKIDDPGAVDELLIKVYHTDAELAASGLNEAMLIMYWYDGTEWLPCSETGVNTDNNYIWAKIRDDTSPSLAQMTGTEFGPGGALAIEYDFYHLDDDVTVTFVSVDENVYPEAIENVAVWAGSDTDLAGATIALRETGVNTGIFTGTFKLVGVTPATGEIVVNDGDGIRIHYDDGTDQYWDDATVDDTNPTVDDLFPGKDAITTDNHTTISAYVADAYLKVAWMTVDGVFRGTPITSSGTLDYTPYTLNPLPEGIHNVVVHAEDEAGNVNSTIWYFTVDVVKPTATISINFTGDVKAGDVKFYADFNEGMKNETGIAFVSNVTTSITFAAQGKWTANQTYTIKAEILGFYNGTAQVNATLAKDLAENVMTKASYTFYIDTVDPTAPGSLNATALADSVVLEWLASADFGGVDLYKVYRGTAIGACDTLLGSSPHPTVTFTDTTLLASGIYFYEVKAYDEAGNSAISNEANATFIVAPIVAYNVSLTKYWNLFSLPLIPDDSSIEVVLADVMENVTIVWSYQDDAWLSYIPAVPSLSTLTTMEDGKGYWIQMATNDTLEVNGYELPDPDELPPVYPVTEGWNMIGFKSVDKMLIETYLTTIPILVLDSSVCYGWDATLQAYEMVYLARTPLTAVFEPGQGYWLFLPEDANIAPPAS